MSSPFLVNLACLMPQPTGISTYVLHLFPQLRSLHPTLLTAQAIEGYTCYSIPGGMTAAQGTQGHLKRLLWTQGQLPSIYNRLQAKLLFSPVPEAPLWSGCRSIVMVHDLIPLRFPRRFSPLTLYTRSIVPRILNRVEHIVVNSEATARDIVDFFSVPAQRITPIPLAYDASHFRWLNLPTQNYFLYLGRLDPYKNVQRLIAAFAQLGHRYSDYQLYLAGPPDQRYLPLLQKCMVELQVTERVKFLHYVPYAELPRLLNQAIALVFPTLWEGFGLPALEAMACGTPVITSNLASLPEVTGGAALLIDPYKVQEIATAMEQIIIDRRLWSDLRSAGLKQATQFSWVKTGQTTASLLQHYL
ncbi:MAG TPA: glycosyltransferase family 1 protein [Coleofasciculaceae cyanobacterium]